MSKRGFDKLRIKAEEQLAASDRKADHMELADLKSLAHELAVHQVELEIQNEELRQSRTAAEEARDRYLDLFDFAPVGYFTLDEHIRIIEANLTGYALLGVDKRTIKNKPFTRFVADDETDSFYLYRKKVLEADTKQTFILKMRKVNGSPFYSQLDGIKTGDDGIRIAVSDITERKTTEEALAKSENLYHSLFENMIDGYAYCHMIFENGRPHDYVYINVNAAYEKLTGLKNVIGKSATEVIPGIKKSNPELFEIYGRVALVGTSERFEIYSPPLAKWLSISVYCPQKEYFVVVFENITDRIQAKEEIQKLNDGLVQRTDQAEQLNRELEAFSYSVSHDLKAPLRSVSGFSDALMEDYSGKLDEQGNEYLRKIKESSDRMAKLIDDLLMLAKITSREINFGKVNLSQLAEDAIGELQASDPDRKVKVNITPNLIAYGDRNLLSIVFTNLLGNAWKFSSKVAQPHIEVGTIEKNGKPAYFVRDNGAGFNMEYADKLFKPFQRLHMASDFAGTGIGLSIVQRIAHRHGGKVWAEGKVGEGATFYFTLGQESKSPVQN
jgi:PAS domain S-box-containing protein